MFSEYLFTNIFIFKPCLMFRVYVLFIWRKITKRKTLYIHGNCTQDDSIFSDQKTDLKILVPYSFVIKVYKDL